MLGIGPTVLMHHDKDVMTVGVSQIVRIYVNTTSLLTFRCQGAKADGKTWLTEKIRA